VVRTWQNGAQEFQDVIRKEECDWKMVYLARKGFLAIYINFKAFHKKLLEE
jgi:hypothetical protein